VKNVVYKNGKARRIYVCGDAEDNWPADCGSLWSKFGSGYVCVQKKGSWICSNFKWWLRPVVEVSGTIIHVTFPNWKTQ